MTATNWQKIWEEQILMKIDIWQYDCFLYHQGLGETCMFAFLFSSYKKFHKKKILIFACSPARVEILKQCPAVDLVVAISRDFFIYMIHNLAKSYRMKNTLDLYDLEYPKQVISMKDQICAYLNIPLATKFEKYCLYTCKDKVIKLFDQYSLQKNKTILIVPDAVCFGSHVCSLEFWRRIVEKLKIKGYNVIFNSNKEILPDVLSFFLDINTIVELAGFCGHVIGVRTGLLDVFLAFSEVKMQIIYPDDHNLIWIENPALKVNYETMQNRARYAMEHDNVLYDLSNHEYNFKKYIYSPDNDNLIEQMTQEIR